MHFHATDQMTGNNSDPGVFYDQWSKQRLFCEHFQIRNSRTRRTFIAKWEKMSSDDARWVKVTALNRSVVRDDQLLSWFWHDRNKTSSWTEGETKLTHFFSNQLDVSECRSPEEGVRCFCNSQIITVSLSCWTGLKGAFVYCQCKHTWCGINVPNHILQYKIYRV